MHFRGQQRTQQARQQRVRGAAAALAHRGQNFQQLLLAGDLLLQPTQQEGQADAGAALHRLPPDACDHFAALIQHDQHLAFVMYAAVRGLRKLAQVFDRFHVLHHEWAR